MRGHLRVTDDGPRSNPMRALTGSRVGRITLTIPWSFEPAGLQPR